MLRVTPTTILAMVLAMATVAGGQTPNEHRTPRSGQTSLPASKPEDDCTLGEVSPLLEDSPANPVERFRNGPRELTERTRLNPQVRVDVVQGGCAHYGVRMLFMTRNTAPAEGRRERVLQDALRVLGLLKQRTTSPVIPDTMSVIAAHERESYKENDPLQAREHPDVTVYVSARETAEATTVEVLYSFVL